MPSALHTSDGVAELLACMYVATSIASSRTSIASIKGRMFTTRDLPSLWRTRVISKELEPSKRLAARVYFSRSAGAVLILYRTHSA